MGTSLGVSDTMALISSKLSKLVPWSGCALFLYEPETERCAAVLRPAWTRRGCSNATLAVGQGLSGWVARNRRSLINADPRVSFEAAGIPEPTVLNAALVCPLYFEDGFLGCLALYHTTPNYYAEDHRRLLERVGRAGGRRHPQLDRLRADAGRLAHRSADRPAEPAVAVRPPVARAVARRAAEERGGADRDGRRRIQGHQRHLRPQRRRRGAARHLPGELQQALRPYDLCVRYAGDEFIVVLADCSREAAEAKRQRTAGAGLREIELVVRPGRVVRLAVSAGVAVFPHDGATYETLLAEADQRMYRDKADAAAETCRSRVVGARRISRAGAVRVRARARASRPAFPKRP